MGGDGFDILCAHTISSLAKGCHRLLVKKEGGSRRGVSLLNKLTIIATLTCGVFILSVTLVGLEYMHSIKCN